MQETSAALSQMVAQSNAVDVSIASLLGKINKVINKERTSLHDELANLAADRTLATKEKNMLHCSVDAEGAAYDPKPHN